MFKVNFPLLNSSGIYRKRSTQKIILHHKNQPIITKQFSSTATIANCLTIKVYVMIYNRHNGTNLHMITQCCHGRRTSSAVAGDAGWQFIMTHISYYLLIITDQCKRQLNYTAHPPLANNWIRTFLSLLAHPLQKQRITKILRNYTYNWVKKSKARLIFY